MSALATFRRSLKRRLAGRYFANDLDPETNEIGLGRIEAARRALRGVPLDGSLRRQYEKCQFTRLPGHAFAPIRFESVRTRAIAALDDPRLSPCAFLEGSQAERQGIPREVVTHAVRRYTTDVPSLLPDVAALLDEGLAKAIRSCIGSNFALEDVVVTRNFHVEPEITARYELLSERWHFDHQIPDGFSLFVCLSEVTDRDGPFHVLSAPDSRLLLRRGFDAARRITSPTGGLPPGLIEGMESLTRLTGPPGSMLLCHTSYCLHRAGIPEAGRMRDMLVFTFRPMPEMDLRWPRPRC